MNRRCNQYMGDNDGTNPQLTCIRGAGHPGPCDNVRGDFQVWGYRQGADELKEPRPVSFAYAHEVDAKRVRVQATRLLTGWNLYINSSEIDNPIHYGDENKVCLASDQAAEMFGRFGW